MYGAPWASVPRYPSPFRGKGVGVCGPAGRKLKGYANYEVAAAKGPTRTACAPRTNPAAASFFQGGGMRTRHKHVLVCPHCEGEVVVSVEARMMKKRGKKFKPPTKQQCRDYAAEKELHINPDFFFDFFDESGWVDSRGNKVRNWKGKMQTWHGRNFDKERPYTGRRVGDGRRMKRRAQNDSD